MSITRAIIVENMERNWETAIKRCCIGFRLNWKSDGIAIVETNSVVLT